MKILALELSSAKGSLAWRDGNAEECRDWRNDRKNSGPFFENLENILNQYGWPETIIVGLGPGSYAGIRIAISAAIGLSFGGTRSVASPNLGRSEPDWQQRGCPSMELKGFPSICAIDTGETEFCVVGDARRQSFFFAHVCDNDLREGPTLMPEDELREKIAAVRKNMSIFASEELPRFERVKIAHPSAKVLARLASDAKRSFVLPPLEPMYLREPHITIPKPLS